MQCLNQLCHRVEKGVEVPQKIVFSSFIPYAKQNGHLYCVQTANPSITYVTRVYNTTITLQLWV